VDLNMSVPAGTGHRISVYGDNTEVVVQLHRDQSGVSYPYAIGSLGAITGSTGGSSYYYYLYDWEVRTPDVVVESARTEVLAQVSAGVPVQVKAFHDGAFDAGTGLMHDALRQSGLIPTAEPYTAMGYVHVGGGAGAVGPRTACHHRPRGRGGLGGGGTAQRTGAGHGGGHGQRCAASERHDHRCPRGHPYLHGGRR